MSLTFTFVDDSSVLHTDFFPPIELEKDIPYEIGLLAFESYNAIPNVDSNNNKFHFKSLGTLLPTGVPKSLEIAIPTGTYEVKDIAKYIEDKLIILSQAESQNYKCSITTNNNTLQSIIKANFEIDLTPDDSIGRLLGFEKKVVASGHELATPQRKAVDIFKVNSISVECSIVTGSYVNGRVGHVIYQFFPNVPAGYRLLELPDPVIYLPLTNNIINSITLRIVDQNGRLVDFREELITIRLHLRKAI